jgi:DNA-binding NtrC family response regulator
MSMLNLDTAAGAALALGTGWPTELLGSSPVARRLRDRTCELARGRRPALIIAPPGFDAGPIADAMHVLGGGRGALVTVDCAAEGLETEPALFGPPAGRRGRSDLFEEVSPASALGRAQGGTLVLLAAHELPAAAQLRLARVLRDGEVRVNGGSRTVRLDQRVIATSELPLDDEVQGGRFRADLFKRFAARQVVLVPLRERREDIGPMAQALMVRAAAQAGRAPREFTQAALALLAALGWEGNLSELGRLVSDLVERDSAGPIRVEDVLAVADPGLVASVAVPRASLREARRQFEREYIAAVLRQSGWHMGEAARVLGIQRTNLYRKARQLGIARRTRGGS